MRLNGRPIVNLSHHLKERLGNIKRGCVGLFRGGFLPVRPAESLVPSRAPFGD